MDLYPYYSAGGIRSGITYNDAEFFLNGKPFQIFSGSLHYFRLHPNSWKDSIKKMQYCHLNTVCTYVPWNLHEQEPGTHNFNHNLDLKAFMELVKNEGMFLILRIGPYVCAEIDFGGLPGWLLKDKNMKLRTNYAPYLDHVKSFFTELIALVHDYQFTISGGPIIAVQLENEFGSFGDTQNNRDDYIYMNYLKDLVIDLGINEMLFTCDMPSVSFSKGSIPDILMTANFQTDAEKEIEILKSLQPDKPLMVAELWSGWFDHWGDKHEEISVDIFVESLKVILSRGSSFNIYVFQGGTNYGFSNGANIGFPLPETPYSSTVTSYDYGALLTENGDCTEKYFATLSILMSLEPVCQTVEVTLTSKSKNLQVDDLPVTEFLPLNEVLLFVEGFDCSEPVVMEDLGQTFGYILYKTSFDKSGLLKFNTTQGVRTMILVNFIVISVIECSPAGFHELQVQHTSQNGPSILWMLVENLGRVNFTESPAILNNERRGIFGPSMLGGIPLSNWTVYRLDFNEEFINTLCLCEWEEIDVSKSAVAIGFYRARFDLMEMKNTFLYSLSWSKGVAFVNKFNIGRYWKIGPQQTLFVSKHLLKEKMNQIFVFETHKEVTHFQLKDSPVLNINEEL